MMGQHTINQDSKNSGIDKNGNRLCFSIVYEDAAGNHSQISIPFGEQYYEKVSW
jgi:hypothetical protein